MALNDNTSTDQVATGDNIYVQSLLNLGWRWDMTSNAGRTIQYVFDGTWTAGEQATIEAVFDAWEQVANIHIEEGTDANAAEIVLHHSTQAGIGGFFGNTGTPFHAVTGSTQMLQAGSFPAVTVVKADVGRVHTYIAFDSPPFVGGLGSGTPGIDIGEMGFEMILHEIGHVLGLKHPHDGGASDSTARFPSGTGGISGLYDFGDNRLNQSIYTAMSYNTNYDANSANLDYPGMMAGPMAFDIAAIQTLYGAVERNGGDNTYVLPDATSTVIAWTSIWDTAGDDTIAYDGTANVVINLTAATLDNSSTGGGMPSYTYVLDAFGNRVETSGGFTIAGDITNFIPDKSFVTGVIIENARGGSGNDEITGNLAANRLFGNGGFDILDGDAGNDFLDGGAGDDTLLAGAGNDILHGGAGADLIGGGSGAEQFDHLDIATFAAAFTINLQTGQHTGEAAGDFYVSIEQFNGSPESDTMVAALLQSVRFAGGDGNDFLFGGDSSDWLQGGKGADHLDGGGGFSDVASYADAPNAITVDLSLNDGTTDGKVFAGDWGFDTLVSIESVEGTAFSDYMIGDERDNRLFGLADADYLQGSAGDDTLTGGTGGDIFAFRTGDGTDTIKDFNTAEGDRIDLSGTGLSFSDLQNQNRITQEGSNTIINLGSGLVLENFDSATLTSAQFLFDSPTDIALVPGSIAETSPVGTVVGALSATDPDAGETFTFELLGNPDGLFSIEGANLVLAGALDYETAISHSILVQVVDSDGHSFRKLVTVGVIDADVEAYSDSYSTNEDTPLTVASKGVLGNDTDDDGDTLSAILVSGPDHGALTLDADGSFTYTPDADYNGGDFFTYKANDGALDSNVATVSITVNSVNDAPEIQPDGDEATYHVRVNNAAVTTIVATDVDGDDVTYSIVGGADAAGFSIDGDTGELTLGSLSAPPNASYLVHVQADDGNGGVDVQDIEVTITGDKMTGDAAQQAIDVFVCHAEFGANTIRNFDVVMDILQFDTGMFGADTREAVLAAARETRQGDVVIATHAGHLEIVGVTLAELQAHADIVFV